MSIPNLMSAIAQGYNAKQIVDWLINSGKKIGKNIRSAKAQGYDDDQIVSYLTKGKHASHGQKNEMTLGMTEQEKGSRIFNQGTDWTKVKKGIGIAAKVAGSLYGLSKAVPAIAQGVQGVRGLIQNRGNPPNQPPPPSGIGPQPMGGAPVQPNQPLNAGGVAQNAPQSPNQPQAVQPPSPPAQTQPNVNSAQIINSMGIGSQIQNLAQAGNNPEAIATAVGVSLKPNQRKWLDEQIKAGTAKALPDMVADFLSESKTAEPIQQPQPVEEQNAQNVKAEIPKAEEKIESPFLKNEEWKAKSKGESVITPSGTFGNIESIRDKEALVKDENGKLHKVEADDLITSPIPEKDLADLHDELIQGIEKETGEEVSRNVNYAGYNPQTNRLLYIPHGGGAYVYGNISPEEKENLTSVLGKRKSSGENFIGAWFAGTKSPIGAQMSEMIKRLQTERGGKGNEYEEKFDVVYNAFEPAIKAAKKKKAEKKRNERKR